MANLVMIILFFPDLFLNKKKHLRLPDRLEVKFVDGFYCAHISNGRSAELDLHPHFGELHMSGKCSVINAMLLIRKVVVSR